MATTHFTPARVQGTTYAVLFAVTAGHLINDTLQALQVRALRHGSPHLLAVHVVRSRQPLRVHAALDCPGDAQERPELLHVVRLADRRRAGDHHAEDRHGPKGIRQPLQFLAQYEIPAGLLPER